MDSKKITKIAALTISAIILVIPFLDIDIYSVALHRHCKTINHFTFHFFHANIFHAILNIWSFLAVVFVSKVSLPRIIFAFLITSAIPVNHLPGFSMYTVGFSAVVYFLFASVAFQVQKKLSYNVWLAVSVLLGFVLPYSNGWIHLYAYLTGLLFGVLNTPFKLR